MFRFKWLIWRANQYTKPLLWLNKNYGRVFIHEKSGFIITTDTGLYSIQNATVKYLNEVVLEWKDGGVYKYHRGRWEQVFWKFYNYLYRQHQEARFRDYEKRFKGEDDDWY